MEFSLWNEINYLSNGLSVMHSGHRAILCDFSNSKLQNTYRKLNMNLATYESFGSCSPGHMVCISHGFLVF